MTTISKVDFGNDGEPIEPIWHLLFTDADDLETAHFEWTRVIREMREVQTLSAANGHAIYRLVNFRVHFERAARHVAEHGAVCHVAKAGAGGGTYGEWNPHWAVMKQADEHVRHLETELGISPIRRARAEKALKRGRATKGSDAYIKKTA